nr:sigma-54-dependent Fis family transcriptional regulator [candidate division Zixibacteria bacterium]
MKADYIDFNELLNMSDGCLHMHGRRLVLHSTNAFAQFRKDLYDMIGPEQTRRLLTRFGYFWGQADAAAMKRIFNWDNVMDWLQAGPWLHMLSGVGKVIVRVLEVDESTEKFYMETMVENSCEAEEHLTSIGKARHPSCWNLIGYMSGFASFCMNRNIYFIEKQCAANGDKACLFIGQDRQAWGDKIKNHLAYFEAEDIQGNVAQLTRQLQLQTRELERQRREIGLLRWTSDPFFAEVRSQIFKHIMQLAARVAQFDSSILITGETGVGKEVLARYVHRHSQRSRHPFVVVNCGALPETLLESELFGHRAGSFTGATRDRIGLLQQAHKGTVFLDEIGDISANIQLKILRVLQEKEITRVGDTEPLKIDVRIIAATNRDLNRAVNEGRFRDDLLYRLRVIEINVPPLRERTEDILPTARYLVDRLAQKLKIPQLKLDSTCVDYLQAYQWPGNIRELENAIERAAVLSHDGIIRPENLPPEILKIAGNGTRAVDPLSMTLVETEQKHINAVMKLCHDNRTRAAKILGISPSTLWRKLKTMDS